MLRRGSKSGALQRSSMTFGLDADAAEVVRSFARGNETVPTVVIGDVGFVNPTASAVEQHLKNHAPHLCENTPKR